MITLIFNFSILKYYSTLIENSAPPIIIIWVKIIIYFILLFIHFSLYKWNGNLLENEDDE